MCLICRDLDNLTLTEAVNNYKEIKDELTTQHQAEIVILMTEYACDNIKKGGIPETYIGWAEAYSFLVIEGVRLLEKG